MRSRMFKIVLIPVCLVLGAVGGTALAGGAFAATDWVVGLNAGSSGQTQSGTVSNLTVTAVLTPAPGNLLYPGGSGDVVLTISNPNAFPVTVTAVNLPPSTTYATGYTTGALTTTQTSCLSTTPSGVTWNYATGVSGSSHNLTTALVVGANATPNDPLTVVLANDARMATTAPAACENTYFSMPSLTGVTAIGGSGTATVTPATDSWTS